MGSYLLRRYVHGAGVEGVEIIEDAPYPGAETMMAETQPLEHHTPVFILLETGGGGFLPVVSTSEDIKPMPGIDWDVLAYFCGRVLENGLDGIRSSDDFYSLVCNLCHYQPLSNADKEERVLSLWLGGETPQDGKDRQILRELAQKTIRMWGQWRTAEVRKRYIPLGLDLIMLSVSASQQTPIGEVQEELASIQGALERHKIEHVSFQEIESSLPDRYREVIISTQWAKDLGLIPPDRDQSILSCNHDGFHLTGGMAAPGHFETKVMLVSDGDYRKLVHEVRGAAFPDVRVYFLPPGFSTFRIPGTQENVLLGTTHIDLVINALPKGCTARDKSILLVDPYYAAELQSNPRFRSHWREFLHQQNPVVVQVHPDECHLNPANFSVINENLVLMNKAPRTIERLVQAGLQRDCVITTDREIVFLPMLLGSIGCTIGYWPLSGSRGAKIALRRERNSHQNLQGYESQGLVFKEIDIL